MMKGGLLGTAAVLLVALVWQWWWGGAGEGKRALPVPIRHVPSCFAPQNERSVLVAHEHLPVYTRYGSDERLLAVVDVLLLLGNDVVFVGRSAFGHDEHWRALDTRCVPHLASVEGDGEALREFMSDMRVGAVVSTLWFWRDEPVPLQYAQAWEGLPVLVISDDCHHARAADLSANDDPARVEAVRRAETAALRGAEAVWMITEEDRACMARLLEADGSGLPPPPMVVLPYTYPKPLPDAAAIGTGLPFDMRRRVCFLGNNVNPTNRLGVEWFVRKVWRRVHSRLRREQHAKALRLEIAGAPPTDGWSFPFTAWFSSEIITTGYVIEADLPAFFARCRVFVAPILHGTGINTKVVAAAVHAVPVVTTDKGATGLRDTLSGAIAVVPGAPPDARAFADTVVDIFADEVTWTAMSRNAASATVRHLSGDRMLQTVRHAIAQTPTSAGIRDKATERKKKKKKKRGVK